MGTPTTDRQPPLEAPVTNRSGRLESVDLLRGVVIVLMALDHVRDFFSDRLWENPVDLNVTTGEIFLTRWVTHFCAPTFIFLAGTGAFLSGTRGKSKVELSVFLVTRGLWLVFLELTIIRMSWSFQWWEWHELGAGVFWAIGWSMVVLSYLIFLPTWAVTLFGVAMIASHNLLDGLTAQQLHLPEWLWVILHQPGGATIVGKFSFGTSYCLIPWMGVMAAGYGFGKLLLLDPPTRRQSLFVLGMGLTLAFVVIRATNLYGDPNPWTEQPRDAFIFYSFLNCTKYPASLCYVLMTLGPSILFLALFDGVRSPVLKPIITFGRVPLFFYLLHVPLIHGGAVLLDLARFGWSPQWLDGPWAVERVLKANRLPADYGVSLPMVYMLWIVCLLILYPLCHWFAGVKQRYPNWRWLSYL